MKRRKLTMLLCILSVFAVASVGFAAWLITSGAKDQASGNIVAAGAEKNMLDVELSFVEGQGSTTTVANPSFIFGYGAVQGTNDWLSYENIDAEHLTVWLLATVDVSELETYAGYSFSCSGLKLWRDANADGEFVDSEEVAANESLFKVKAVEFHLTSNDNSQTITNLAKTTTQVWMKLELEWGDAFDGTNPFKFYNDHVATDKLSASDASEGFGTANDTWAQTAKDQLDALNTFATNLKFYVEVEVNPVKTI